ncbi:ATP-binding protein [Patescibacteria group bacterium]|nr:ATP-binding protein [Patescibacteria group bacterium]
MQSFDQDELAQLTADLKLRPDPEPLEDLLAPRLPRIVLTGGPCSGKSKSLRLLGQVFGELVQCVPEVVTWMIGQVGIRAPKTPVRDIRFVRELSLMRRSLENLADQQARIDGKYAVVVDRGLIDAAAYRCLFGENIKYPFGPVEELMQIIGSTREYEFGQYDLVICLEVPPEEVFKDKRRNNPSRSKDYANAARLGKSIAQVWGGHPNFHLIPNLGSWDDKYAAVRQLVSDFLEKLET